MIAEFPIDKFKVTSPFGWRKHPIGGAKKHHNGVDLVGPVGGPIQSFTRGRVIFAGPSKRKKADGSVGGFGYHVQVRSKINGKYVVATYAHMRKGSLQVKVGDIVTHESILGRQGTTGDSTGEHLHFEITLGKNYRWTADGSGYADPLEFIKAVRLAHKAEEKAKAATPEDAPVAPVAVHTATPKAKVAPKQPAGKAIPKI
jgi:murein DD-endopeptidase MepM/ murein hydrolase activator NlpD